MMDLDASATRDRILPGDTSPDRPLPDGGPERRADPATLIHAAVVRCEGASKYPGSTLLASSAGLGWSMFSAELRRHDIGEAPPVLSRQVEVCLAVIGNDAASLQRATARCSQQSVPGTGAIWLSPAGITESVRLSAPVPKVLHLYLSKGLFDRLSEDFDVPATLAHAVHHVAGIKDDVISQVGRSVLSALSGKSSAGRMVAEAAAMTLAARLFQKYCANESDIAVETLPGGLDRIRLERVLDYIAANIQDEITLTDLAAIAGYSPYHFARKFRGAMGLPPHHYLSRLRVEKAMSELATGRLPIAEIALNAQFSSQASFTRAFHRITGVTPREYRLGHR